MQRPSEDSAKISVSIAGKLAPSPSARFVLGYDIKLLHKKGGTQHGKAGVPKNNIFGVGGI